MRVEAVLKIALFEVQTIWMFALHALMLLPFCPVSEILIHQPMSELFFVYFMVEPFLKHHHLCHYPAIFSLVQIVVQISITIRKMSGK